VECGRPQKAAAHLLHIARYHECGKAALGIVLSSGAHDVALSAGQKYSRSHADIIEIWVVGEGREDSGSAVVNIAHAGKEGAHVGVHGSVGGVCGCIVTLIGVSGIDHDCLVEVIQAQAGLQLRLRIAVRAYAEGIHLDLLPRDQVLHDVGPAVLNAPVLGGLGGSKEEVDGGDAPVGLHPVEKRSADLYRWIAVA